MFALPPFDKLRVTAERLRFHPPLRIIAIPR